MNIYPDIKHPIQKHIIQHLTDVKQARFGEMRPAGIDSNLYTYHLKKLVALGYVNKINQDYRLGPTSLLYVDGLERNRLAGLVPLSAVQFVVQNSDGDVLLAQHASQPFIGSWTLPGGYIYEADVSVMTAAQRIATDVFAIDNLPLERAGSCYNRVLYKDKVVYNRLVQVFRFESDAIKIGDNLAWARPHKLGQYELFPGTEDIMTRTFFRDPDYFEEFTLSL